MLKVAHALNDNYMIVGSVVIILILLMWDYLKNFFLGLVFSFQYGYLGSSKIVVNNNEGLLINYSSSYFELLTNKGLRLKIKYQDVYAGKFEKYSSNLHRVFRKIRLLERNEASAIKASIMNHPLFLLNGQYKFYEEVDEKGQFWLCFYFHVMSRQDANVLISYVKSIGKNM